MLKRKFLISLAIIVVLLLVGFCFLPKDTGVLYKGMTAEEINNNGDVWCVWGLVVCKNKNGDSVIGYRSDLGEITKISVYPKATPTPKAFSKIENGMSFEKVIKLIGLPKKTVLASGGSVFELTDGTCYTIIWNFDNPCKLYAEIISKHPA